MAKKTAKKIGTKEDTDSPRSDQRKILERAHGLASAIVLRSLGEDALEAAVREMRSTIQEMIENPREKSHLERVILLYSYASLEFLPNYTTLDYSHFKSVDNVLRTIRNYVEDESLTRPLNFLLLASPGSGKSHLIRSISRYLYQRGLRVGDVSFNMATMQSKEDLRRVLDTARNVAIDGKLPLVFLDEFDSHDSNYPLLLPLLWDGELDVGHGDLRLGRSVFFLAGSRATLPDKLNSAREMVASRASNADDSKLVDLFSRINGTVIRLPSMSDIDEDRMPDKLLIAMHLLRQRFKTCRSVHWSILWFIAQAYFRYEARSIATLINLIPTVDSRSASDIEDLTLEHLNRLPLEDASRLKESPLAFHLIDGSGERGIAKLWARAKQIDLTQQIRFAPPQPVERPPHWLLGFLASEEDSTSPDEDT